MKSNLIPLTQIEGVDLDNLTFDRPKDLPNYKAKLRPEVLESLKTASSPEEIPPIPVYAVGKNKYKLIDGEHRLQNALFKLKATTDKQWEKINVFVDPSVKTEVDGCLVGFRSALQENFSALDDQETYRGVADLLEKLGGNTETLVEKIGVTNKRVVNMVNRIKSYGGDYLKKAIAEGNISLDTASKIVKVAEDTNQQTTLAVAAQSMAEEGATTTEINRSLGLRKDRAKLLSVKKALEYSLPIAKTTIDGYKQFEAQRSNPDAKGLRNFLTDIELTRFEVVCAFFGMEDYTMDSQIEFFQEKLDNE